MKTKNLIKKYLNTKNPKYLDAGCGECKNGQITYHGETALDVTSYIKCSCAETKTELYINYLEKVPKLKKRLTVDEFESFCFYNNNAHIKTGNNATDRSW